MPYFFVKKENITDENVYITEKSDVKHILNVLRCGKKDKLILQSEDNQVIEAVIKSVGQDKIECEIIESYTSDKTLEINITLAQSVIKSQKQDFVIQKATELGVKEIIPFISRNTVVKFESEQDKLHKIHRWQKIMYESAKQCRRGDLAKLEKIISFDELIKLEGYNLKVLCSEKKAEVSIKQFLRENKDNIKREAKILLIIGPEGGWDDAEIEIFIQNHITPLTLGKLVYRAETASTAALSHIIYEYEF